MNIFNMFIQSLRFASRRKKMIFLLWFLSFLFSLPVFYTIHQGLKGYLTGSRVPAEWMHQFNANYLVEMIVDQPTLPQTFVPLVFAVSLISLLLSVFTTAGMAGVIYKDTTHLQQDKSFLPAFFENAGQYVGRFFRNFLWTLVLSVISLVFAAFGVWGFVISALLVCVWIMASDVAKIRLIAENSTRVTRIYFPSLVWVLKNLAGVGGIYLLNLVLLAAGFAIYKIVDQAFDPNAVGKILLLFVVQQLFIGFRSLMRIQFFTSIVLFRQSRAVEVQTGDAAAVTVQPA
jgi:hypothetical protein